MKSKVFLSSTLSTYDFLSLYTISLHNVTIKHNDLIELTCADPESFVIGGLTLTTFFSVDKGREDPNTTISGPLVARQRIAI